VIVNTSDQPDPLFVTAFENGDYGISIACLLGIPDVRTELDKEVYRAATYP
jgi:hypothetical protein